MPHKDREAKLAYMREYNRRPERREKQRVYSRMMYQTPEGKAYHRKHTQKWKRSASGQISHWRDHLKRTYNLSLEQYHAMVLQSCGLCDLCGESFGKKPCVDHDLVRGEPRVRGLICDPCNQGLRCFRDTPRHMLSAIAYLVKFGYQPPSTSEIQEKLGRVQ